MDRLALSGLAIATVGLIGLLSAELVSTAHAGRGGERSYLVAVSQGSALTLMRDRSAQTTSATEALGTRRLACARLVSVSDLSLGFNCR